MNSTPFWRQNSINSYHSPGSSSGHDTGGSNQNSRGKWGDSSNSNSSTATNSISGATAVGIPQWQSSLESMERSIPTEGKDFVHPQSANKSTGDKEEHGQSTLETSSLLNSMERSNDASSPTKGEDLDVHLRSTNRSPSGEEEHGHSSLETIKLGRELLRPMWQDSELRQSMHNSLAKQYSFQELIEQQKIEKRKSKHQHHKLQNVGRLWLNCTMKMPLPCRY